jgi:flagellar protein FliJ
MKRFVWRLQRVLDIREKEEQIKRAELFAITEQLTKTQDELLVQKNILKKTIEELSQAKPCERLGKQQLFFEFSAVNDKLIANLEKKIKGLKKQQQEKIQEVIKIKKYKEGLGKLRTQAKEQFVKEQEKLEQTQMDELTTMRFARKTMLKETSGKSNRLESEKQLIAK